MCSVCQMRVKVCPHFHSGEEIERAKRFVHVNDVGICRQGAGDFDPLPHATGKFSGIGILESIETNHFDIASDDFILLIPAPARRPKEMFSRTVSQGKTPFS